MKRKNKLSEAPTETAVAEETVQQTAETAASEEAVPQTAETAETPGDAAAETAEEKKSPSAVSSVVKITLPLSIICIVIALMLAVVNALTADTIAANAAREKEAAIFSIFTEGDGTELNFATDGTEVYRVKSGDTLLGYCASLEENGFGGAITMMVGIDTAGNICGVQIVSLSETPGIGTKVKSDSFLSRFSGNQPFVIGDNFDAISGATVSSKAVVRGVNRARTAVANTFDLEEAPEEEVQMQLPQTETSESAPAVMEKPAESDAPTAETSSAEESRSQIQLASVLPSWTIASLRSTVNRVTLASSETIVIGETTQPAVETEAPETVPAETSAAAAETTASESVPTEGTSAAAV